MSLQEKIDDLFVNFTNEPNRQAILMQLMNFQYYCNPNNINSKICQTDRNFRYLIVEIDDKKSIFDFGGLQLIDMWFDDVLWSSINNVFAVAIGNKKNYITTDLKFIWNKPIEEWFVHMTIKTLDHHGRIQKYIEVSKKDITTNIYKYNILPLKANAKLLWNKPIDRWFRNYIRIFVDDVKKMGFKLYVQKTWYEGYITYDNKLKIIINKGNHN